MVREAPGFLVGVGMCPQAPGGSFPASVCCSRASAGTFRGSHGSQALIFTLVHMEQKWDPAKVSPTGLWWGPSCLSCTNATCR